MADAFIIGPSDLGAFLQRSRLHAQATLGKVEQHPLLHAQWVTPDRRPIGEPFQLNVPGTPMVENFAPSGRIALVEVDPFISFESHPPAGAAYLELRSGAYRELIDRSVVETTSPQAPEGPAALFPPDGGAFEFPVFAERFTDRQKFHALVRQLQQWITTIPPFDAEPVKSRFALRAFYWTSDPTRGRFDTLDQNHGYDCERDKNRTWAWPVKNHLARPAVKNLMREGKYGLVLIDSDLRGGAGGIADQGWPAWASRAECHNEKWCAIALHEMGHSFGLADEYGGGLTQDCLMGGTQNRTFCDACSATIAAKILDH